MDKWLLGLVIVSVVLLPLVFIGNLNEASGESHQQPEAGESEAVSAAEAAANPITEGNESNAGSAMNFTDAASGKDEKE